jgi:hypothetical protein
MEEETMDAVSNPLAIQATPESVRPGPASYRDGKLQVVTFESDTTHLCYSLDEAGALWDFCSIDYSKKKVVHIEGQLSPEEIAEVKLVAGEFDAA